MYKGGISMLTPIDIQNKTFKGGIGFDKKEVEIFMNVLSNDYGTLYSSNVELKDKIATLNESLESYRKKEDTVQKALTLSEITAEEIINAAKDKAKQIEDEAEKKAEAILQDSKQELLKTKNEIDRLQKLYSKFKEQYLNSLDQQIKLVKHEIEEIDLGDDFKSSYETKNSSEFTYGEGSSLGGLGGGYIGSGSMDDRFEQTNQASTSNQTSLNMDPFASAANGGRFSRQTGKGFTSTRSDSDKNTTTVKTAFNVKSTASSHKPLSQQKPVQESQHISQPKPVSEPQPVPKPKPIPKPVPQPKPVHESNLGGVKNIINESIMFESEDNDSFKFNFTEQSQSVIKDIKDENEYKDEDTVYGEVEDKVNKATMLDSEDNYSDGFDFVSEDTSTTEPSNEEVYGEETYSGEVEIGRAHV